MTANINLSIIASKAVLCAHIKTEQKIKQTCRGAAVSRGLAIQGSSVDNAKTTIENWV